VNWINDFWNVMWPVFAGAGSLMLAFAMMFAFIVMPVVLLRIAWGSLVLGPELLRVRAGRMEDKERMLDARIAVYGQRLREQSAGEVAAFREREAADVEQAVEEVAATSQEVEGDAQNPGSGEDAATESVQAGEAAEDASEGADSAPPEDNPPPEIVTAETLQAAEDEAAAQAAQAEQEAERVQLGLRPALSAFTIDDPNEPYQSIMKRLKEWRNQGKAK